MRSDCLPGGFDPSETDPARNDGGPAFPFVEPAGPGVSVAPGMSMRDHFAGLAMQAVMTSAGPTWRDNGWKPVDGMTIMQNNALLAYAAADAMLKARSA